MLSLQPKAIPKRDLEDDDKEQASDRTGKKLRFQSSSHQGSRAVPSTSSVNDSSAPDREELLKLIQEGDIDSLDENALKRLILNFEKRVLKNQELRVKFPDAPEKFMESELELHESVQQLHALATVPELYRVAVENKLIPSLLGLLSHENSDISVAVVNLLQELTDLDTLTESQDEAAILIDELLELQVCALLAHNLDRLDENQREEAEGVHNTLGNLYDFCYGLKQKDFNLPLCSHCGKFD